MPKYWAKLPGQPKAGYKCGDYTAKVLIAVALSYTSSRMKKCLLESLDQHKRISALLKLMDNPNHDIKKTNPLLTAKHLSELAYKLTDIAVISAIIYALFIIFQDRSTYIHKVFVDTLSCQNCIDSTILYHDIPLFSGIVALAIVSLCSRRFFLYIPLRILLLLGMAIYIADVATFKEFFTRLRINDVIQYGEETELVLRHIENTGMLDSSYFSFEVVIALIFLIVVFPPRKKVKYKWLLFLLLIPAVTLIAGRSTPKPSYVYEWAVKNVIDTNLKPGVAIKYSDQFRENTLATAEDDLSCQPGMNQQPDIILLLLESWSPYHSKLWSGLNDWTPKLDNLALEGRYFTNNAAAGFTTNEGLMSLFAENQFLAPIKNFFATYMFEATWDRKQTLPKVMTGAGYTSAFFTSGNLGFTSKGKWLENLGFDYIDGHDNPAYDGIARLHFDSAPDAELYKVTLDFLDNKPKGQPLFTAIETVSTHHPYIHPHTKERSEEKVFRYMDDTADAFIKQLKERGFFDNGVLIVASDHRAMTPIFPAERASIGFTAPAKIPMFILGKNILPQEVQNLTHQSDLIASLKDLSLTQSCKSKEQHSWFRNYQQQNRCVFHAQGADRDHIDVICNRGHGSIKLEGDTTHFSYSENIDNDTQNVLLKRLNRHRIQGDIAHLEFWNKKTKENK